jgi:hypothetical protein
MKRIIVVFIFIVAALNVPAQFDTLGVKKNISTSLDSMTTAFKTSNWCVLAHFTNENAIRLMGSEEAFIAMVDSLMKEMLETARINQYHSGKILQLIKTTDGYQCVVESFMEMAISGTTIAGSSYNIGTSANGENWRFLRIDDNSSLKIKNFIPNLSPQIRIPETQMEAGTTLAEFEKTYKIKYKKTATPVRKTKPAGKTAKPKRKS